MNILAFLVLLSGIAISICGAYFSIIGLKLLFVGGGLSIIIMGTALEIGKIITATFLKQKWKEIGWWMKSYMLLATLFLMGITSIGIYGYLSAGYTATSIAVQGYEQNIESNNTKIAEFEKEIETIKKSDYNSEEIAGIDANRKKFIEQKLQVVAQKNQQIESIRKSANTTQDASADIAAAKQALEISKSSTDTDIARELEQIKLFNARLEILDKEVQKWMDQGTGGLFGKNGLNQARVVKEGQTKERAEIDEKIKSSQDRITKLREQYASQMKEYNDRVAAIESRSKSQRGDIEANIKKLEKDIEEIMASIDAYNKESDNKVSKRNTSIT
jgi:DNA repair exonuclease SbcCD ATPase subunit